MPSARGSVRYAHLAQSSNHVPSPSSARMYVDPQRPVEPLQVGHLEGLDDDLRPGLVQPVAVEGVDQPGLDGQPDRGQGVRQRRQPARRLHRLLQDDRRRGRP